MRGLLLSTRRQKPKRSRVGGFGATVHARTPSPAHEIEFDLALTGEVRPSRAAARRLCSGDRRRLFELERLLGERRSALRYDAAWRLLHHLQLRPRQLP